MRPFDSFIYHVFPLGACGAPAENDLVSEPVPRLRELTARLDHVVGMGANTVLLGPVWESAAHGYDTIDLFTVDRRLGAMEDLREFAEAVHKRDMNLMLDAVLNHVDRGFWAFQDVVATGRDSPFLDWFHIDLDKRSPVGDPFDYQSWAGNYELVKLNVSNPGVREHLFAALSMWFTELGVDGLRLDAADDIDHDFLDAAAAHVRRLNPEVYLLGEMVGGDYRDLVRPGRLDGATNYDVYKALWSSHVDHNYYEIAWTLNREFGPEGTYRGMPLQTFADNHDVDRVAGSLTNPAHLFPLYGLVFTIPGVPSLYYGSEIGDAATRTEWTDVMLRPSLGQIQATTRDLPAAIRRLAALRAQLTVLRHGDYEQVHVEQEQLVFRRSIPDHTVLVAVNAADDWADVPVQAGPSWYDHLNDEHLDASHTIALPPTWLRVLSAI